MAVDTRHRHGMNVFGHLVPELDCPAPPRSSPGPAPGPLPGGARCDVCALLETLMPALAHFIASGSDGDGNNWGVLITDTTPVQVAHRNPKRVALGTSIPAGTALWHGFNNRVTSTTGQNAGTPVPAGASWLYGPEWTGSVWVVAAAPFPADVRIIDITSR